MLKVIAGPDVAFENVAAIIFDKDGTLEDSLSFWREVGLERARQVDAQVPGVGEPLKMAWGIDAGNIVDPQGLLATGSLMENKIATAAYVAETGKSWHESKKIVEEAFLAVSGSKYLIKNCETAPLFSDVRPTLVSLATKKIKLGILSADTTYAVKKFLVDHQLSEYFQLAMGVDNQVTKPDPELFLQACKLLKVNPAETLMVGDTSGDMTMAQAAKAAGAIEISRRQKSLLEGADVQINTLLEIRTL